MTAGIDGPMTAGLLGPAPDQTCPYLGLETDRATHFAYPSTAQRCHAGNRPVSIDHAKQARDCLTAEHISCSRYHPPTDTWLQGGRLREAVAATAVQRVQPVADGVQGRPALRFPRMRRIARILLIAAVITGAGILGVLVGTRLGTMVAGDVSGTPSPAAGGVLPASPVPSVSAPSPTPTSTPTASPSPTRTPSPTASPTASPTPAPTPIIYIVKRGDILINIAETYGVTTAALVEANGIENPNVIVVGERLVIPRP